MKVSKREVRVIIKELACFLENNEYPEFDEFIPVSSSRADCKDFASRFFKQLIESKKIKVEGLK